MTQPRIALSLPSAPARATNDTLPVGVPAARLLDVPYIGQSASNWCWAACAAMVSRYVFRNGIRMCEVASVLIPDRDCCDGAPPEDGTSPNFASPCNRTCT